jgi:hypothetical protein
MSNAKGGAVPGQGTVTLSRRRRSTSTAIRSTTQTCKAAGFAYTDPTTIDAKTGKPREYVSKLLYDCKRSAIRNLVCNGVPERVALDVAGIKTRSILDRYNITSDRDKRAALEAVSLPTSRLVTNR